MNLIPGCHLQFSCFIHFFSHKGFRFFFLKAVTSDMLSSHSIVQHALTYQDSPTYTADYNFRTSLWLSIWTSPSRENHLRSCLWGGAKQNHNSYPHLGNTSVDFTTRTCIILQSHKSCSLWLVDPEETQSSHWAFTFDSTAPPPPSCLIFDNYVY